MDHTYDHQAADDSRRQPAAHSLIREHPTLFPTAFVHEGLVRKTEARAALCLQIAIADVSFRNDVDDDVEEDASWPEAILSLVEVPVLV